MLTDKDKWDIIQLACKIIGYCKNVYSEKAAVYGVTKVLEFITEHPDLCAAEISDFMDVECEASNSNEFHRLKKLFS